MFSEFYEIIVERYNRVRVYLGASVDWLPVIGLLNEDMHNSSGSKWPLTRLLVVSQHSSALESKIFGYIGRT